MIANTYGVAYISHVYYRHLIYASQQFCVVGTVMIPKLQMGRLRLGEWKGLAPESHSSKQQGQGLNPGFSDHKAPVLKHKAASPTTQQTQQK